MARFEMGLQPKYFNYIAHSTKRIELRLFDEKRRKIQLGDEIEFSCDGADEKVLARVVGLLRYASFEDLFQDFDIAMMADVSETKEDLMRALEEFYTPEKQKEYGVVGIRIELV